MARQKWQKRAETCRSAFRGHCVKTGVYVRSMDSSRRAILDSLVPRSKAIRCFSPAFRGLSRRRWAT